LRRLERQPRQEDRTRADIGKGALGALGLTHKSLAPKRREEFLAKAQRHKEERMQRRPKKKECSPQKMMKLEDIFKYANARRLYFPLLCVLLFSAVLAPLRAMRFPVEREERISE
jgi:hypothetical protein